MHSPTTRRARQELFGRLVRNGLSVFFWVVSSAGLYQCKYHSKGDAVVVFGHVVSRTRLSPSVSGFEKEPGFGGRGCSSEEPRFRLAPSCPRQVSGQGWSDPRHDLALRTNAPSSLPTASILATVGGGRTEAGPPSPLSAATLTIPPRLGSRASAPTSARVQRWGC